MSLTLAIKYDGMRVNTLWIGSKENTSTTEQTSPAFQFNIDQVPHLEEIGGTSSEQEKLENPPEWFNQVTQTVLDAWFDPKSFEQNPGLYEKLGVRKFREYIEIKDVLLARLTWRKVVEDEAQEKLNNISTLKDFESFTRLCEVGHLVSFGLMTAALGIFLQSGSITGAVFVAGINTLMNIYPIMLQRYNRVRLYRVIRKMKGESSNDLPS